MKIIATNPIEIEENIHLGSILIDGKKYGSKYNKRAEKRLTLMQTGFQEFWMLLIILMISSFFMYKTSFIFSTHRRF